MTFAKDVINKAKTKLIIKIKFEVGMIATAVNAEDRNYTDEGDWVWNPAIDVPVDNSYLDVEDDYSEDYYSERRKVVAIGIDELDGEEKVFVNTYEGDEIFAENLSVEELGGICDCLEESYKHLVK